MIFYIDTELMMEELGLSKTELLMYALIHTFSQGKYGCYWGSIPSTAQALGVSRPCINKALDSLLGKGLIECSGINPATNTKMYSSTPVNNLPPQKTFGEGERNLPTPRNFFAPNYKENINRNIRERESNARARFIRPTLDEIRDYAASRSSIVDPEEFFDHYEGNGWRIGNAAMKDWQATFRNWERKRKNTPTPNPFPTQQKSATILRQERMVEQAAYWARKAQE